MQKQDRPIDRERNAAIQAEIGSDGSPIREMISLGDQLLLVTDTSVHGFRTADQVDPERRVRGLPHTQQLILPLGATSSLINRVLLTTHDLAVTAHLGNEFKREVALRSALEVTLDVAAMQTLLERYTSAEEAAAGKYDGFIDNAMLRLPAVGADLQLAEAFLQKAGHAGKSLVDLARIFPPTASARHEDDVAELVAKQMGEDHDAAIEIKAVTRFLGYLRVARNATEHPKPGYRLVLKDFTLGLDKRVWPPTLAIEHPDRPQPEVGIAMHMKDVIDSTLRASQQLIAWLCALSSTGPFYGTVGSLEPKRRHHQDRMFSWFIKLGDTWRPIG